MTKSEYADVVLEVRGKIGIITLNRPKQLNSFGGTLLLDLVGALHELDEHPDTVFTVLTGAGRFFSAGADVTGSGLLNSSGPDADEPAWATRHGTKVTYQQRFAVGQELLRSMIDHRKVLVVAMNGPAVGAGAAWFQSYSDLLYASTATFFDVSFSALALVPEGGSAPGFAEHIGTHRANEMLMFGRRMHAEELHRNGLVNDVFPAGEDVFLPAVLKMLEANLEKNDGKSMMEVKRLQNAGRREQRIMAVVNSFDALSNRFVDGAPIERFVQKVEELKRKRAGKSKL